MSGEESGLSMKMPIGRVREAHRPSRRKPQRVIGVDVGSFKIAVGSFDLAAPRDIDIAERRVITHPFDAGRLVETLTRILRPLVRRLHPVGIGIGLPGQVDLPSQVLTFGPGLRLRNVPVKQVLQQKLGVEVRIDNDVRCATRCEQLVGAGQRYHNFVCIFVGNGVGSGIVAGGRLYVGANSVAGEFGHTRINGSTEACTCGARGCLETLINAPAIVTRAAALANARVAIGESTALSKVKKLTAADIAKCAGPPHNDPIAKQVAEEVGEYLGHGIANYVNILNPAAVVLGGGVIDGFFVHMAAAMQRTFEDDALKVLKNTRIIRADFPMIGAMIGAGLLFHPATPWNYADAPWAVQPSQPGK